MKAIFVTAVLFFALSAVAAAQVSEQSIGITQGVDSNVASEYDAGRNVHSEVVVLRHTRAMSEQVARLEVGASSRILPSSPPADTCVSVLLVADANNGGPIWVHPFGAVITSPGTSPAIPMYPGTRQMFRAPNDGDCGKIQAAAGAGCTPSTSCILHIATQ